MFKRLWEKRTREREFVSLFFELLFFKRQLRRGIMPIVVLKWRGHSGDAISAESKPFTVFYPNLSNTYVAYVDIEPEVFCRLPPHHFTARLRSFRTDRVIGVFQVAPNDESIEFATLADAKRRAEFVLAGVEATSRSVAARFVARSGF